MALCIAMVAAVQKSLPATRTKKSSDSRTRAISCKCHDPHHAQSYDCSLRFKILPRLLDLSAAVHVYHSHDQQDQPMCMSDPASDQMMRRNDTILVAVRIPA